MNSLRILLFPLVLLALPLAASADSWKDESGHGKNRGHDRREYKEEFWDGNCKVERKVKKNGDYKEERKCKAPPRVHYQQAPIYVPAPQPVIVEPGITVHGTVRIRQ